ncbi:hypothetical protein K1X76_11180, partial [bacterium]|nr:hypothetical protein [bacterium]
MFKKFLFISLLLSANLALAQELPPPGEEIVPTLDEEPVLEEPNTDTNADSDKTQETSTPSLEQLATDQEE